MTARPALSVVGSPHEELARQAKAEQLAAVAVALARSADVPVRLIGEALADPALPLRRALTVACAVREPSEKTWQRVCDLLRIAGGAA